MTTFVQLTVSKNASDVSYKALFLTADTLQAS